MKQLITRILKEVGKKILANEWVPAGFKPVKCSMVEEYFNKLHDVNNTQEITKEDTGDGRWNDGIFSNVEDPFLFEEE